mgnify:CR=1 FL=1
MKDLLKHAVIENKPFWYLTVFSTVMILLGILLPWPPNGKIDPSVLTAVGEMIAFGALWAVVKAIDKGTDAKLVHGNTELHITNDEKEKN